MIRKTLKIIIPANVLKSGKKYSWSVSGYREEFDASLANTMLEIENLDDYIAKNANFFRVGTLKPPAQVGQPDFFYGENYTFTVQ